MDDKSQNGATELKPGETIRPGSAPAAQAPAPQEPVLPPVQQTPPAPAVTEQPPQSVPAEEVHFTPQPSAVQSDDPQSVSWTASEFIDHNKSYDWYLALGVLAILSAVVLYFLSKDVITSVTPIVAAIALGFYGRRRPRQLEYHLDSHGLTIDQKHFSYGEFRSFAVLDEGPFVSLVFLPLKRFGFLTTVYLDPEDEERVLNLVSDYLPLEPREHDMVDRLMKRIRF